jgi:hypothetical protein
VVARRPGAPRVDLGGVLLESARILASGFVLFLVAGLMVFVPIGLIEALGLNVANVDGLHGPSVAAVVVGAVLFGCASLLGEVLYSGMVTRGVADERRNESHRPGEILRELPYLRLIAADLLFVLAVTAGLALLVAPGLILLVLFGVIAPVIEVERVGMIAAFRRSAELVRRDFWRAALLLVAVVAISETVDEALQAGVSDALGNTFPAEWAAATLSGVVTAPLFAVPVVVLYFGLAELLPADAPPAALAATSRGTVTSR